MFWLLLSCGEINDCALQSQVEAWTPDCGTAELVRYDGESRLAVGGFGGVLTLYLPEDITAGTTYGGMTGNPLLAVLALTAGDETAFGRTSTMTLAQLGPSEAELQLTLDFDSGAVSGPLVVPVSSP
ncbi:MAG: hypothetical protein P8R54_07875 [Myxococcota bacterium]|nr:hypothetical protein [Myxococcota bacterium]